MAKKSFGKMMVFAAITGAAIGAGLYYLKKYKSFNEELEEEFLDVERDDEDSSCSETEEEGTLEEETRACEMETVEATDIDSEEENKDTADDMELTDEDAQAAEEEELSDASDAKRKYIPLNVNTDKLKAAAKDTSEKAMDVLKDGASILSGFVHDAAPVVKDKVHTLKTKASEKIESYKHAKDNEDSEIDLYDEDEKNSVSLEESSDTEEKEASDAKEESKEAEDSLEKPKETSEAESTIDVEEQKE